jgi:drug/metabolite transporter (DMT)-like permease
VRVTRDERHGLVFAVLSAVFLAAVILLAKSLLRTLSPWTFTAFLFGFGAIWYSLYFVVRREWAVFAPSAAALRAGLVVGVLDAGYTLASFSALQLLAPGVYAFFSHIADLLTVLVGFVLLRERFTRRALVGLVIAFAGLATMTARTESVVAEGLVLMLAAAVCFAATTVVVKRFTVVHSPIHLAYYRAIALTVLVIAFSAAISDLHVPHDDDWVLLATVGLIGPFLNYVCFFKAIQRLAIVRVTLVRMCYSVLVVLGAFIVYAQLPDDRQIAGGLALLAGVMLVVFERSRVTAR